MNKIIYLTLFIALTALQSCDDFLGNKPKGYMIPETYDDYVKLMAEQSLSSGVKTDGFFLTDDVHLLDDTASFADVTFANQGDDIRNLYAFKGGQIATPGNHDYQWNAAYNRIYTYNTVIEDVLSATGGSVDEKRRLRAEALYNRAYEYLNLVNIYGRHYDAATAATDFGVPIITTPKVTQSYKRSTVAEVYQKIEADLKEALPDLKPVALNLFHSSQNSIYSFYARMYLYMGRYEDALTNANKALELNDKVLDLKPYQTKDKKTWYRIVLPDGTPLPDKHENPEAVFVRLQDGRETITVSKDLLSAFQQDLPTGAVDQRRKLFYADDTVNMGRVDRFYGETCYILYSNVNVGFSSIENHLIAAECEARIGSKESAMTHLNTIRDNRIIGNTPLSATDKNDALLKVLRERRREFAFVGYHRLFDLKRLNKEEGLKKTITHQADGKTYTLEPGDNRYIFPINQLIINYNPDMPQYKR